LPTPTEAFDRLKAHLAAGNLRLFLENSRALAAILDPQGVALGWNRAYEHLRGVCPTASTFSEYLSTAARLEFQGMLQDVAQMGALARVQLELGPQSCRSRYDCFLVAQSEDRVLFIGEPIPEATRDEGSLKFILAEQQKLKAELDETKQTLEDKKTELQAVLAQADEVSHTDSLTLSPNRRWIISALQEQVSMSERYGFPLSVSMIDLDNFKAVNDTLGHQAGDQVLRYVASELRDHIRQPDQIGRYGGDEFLVILPNTNEHAAEEQAHRLCEHIREVSINSGTDNVPTTIPMTISVGIAQYRAGVDDWRTLLERADQALYKAKNNGRARWASM
jgi:diguanylate cyclase (GGDEF)-like protein